MAEAVANAGAGATGGADEELVRVLEDTALAKIMEKLEGPLSRIVAESVHEAIVHATHASGTINPEALAPKVPARRQRAAPKAESRPKAGGLCDAVWKELDKLKDKSGQVPTLSMVQKLAKRKHWNENNARVEYYNWRRANGISGRLPQPAVQAQAAAQ